jgi:hypothetical protein
MSDRTTEEREVIKVDPAKVKKDDLMAIIYYVKVKEAKKGELLVTDLQSNMGDIKVNGTDLIQNCMSADFYGKEEKVTMTRLADILTESPNRPLSVCFIKKDGTERILRGKWLSEDRKMGRSNCEDLDVVKTDKEDGLRQVDHRTIQWLVVDGVRYVLKTRK